MQKPNAIVFFDLDGTLLNSQVEVLPSSISAINKLRNNNIVAILSTGRSADEVRGIMQKTGIDSIVGMNGQSVIYKGQKIYTNDIPVPVIERIIDFSVNQSIPLAFYNDNIRRVSAHDQATKQLYQSLHQTIPDIDSELYKKVSIQMLLLLCQKGEDKYLAHFPELKFIRNNPYCVDVFNHNGSKGNGIRQLLSKLNLTDVPTYAFGDGFNDLEMFNTVDHPIAMKNGVEPLKELAEFITDDHNHDGIAKGLQKAGLI
ncbi:MAG: Cof-type HAD-IIB family hydrolase [Candidatus Schmidhempelia sp.]|nr:Cof-type HAD-IIB family hydrolase [Candidatus Schmidhempelia sp.]